MNLILIDTINLIGTFLLAVEAIKVKNFISFREGFIISLGDQLNPKIDKEGNLMAPRNFLLILFSCHLVAGVLLNFFLLREFAFVAEHYGKFDTGVISISIFIVAAFFGGAILWTSLIYAFKMVEYILRKIESNTRSGAIGLIGFLTITLSFVLRWTTSAS